MENPMFCYQCEQTAGGKGCTKLGVCGKTPEIANLQDLLIYQLKGISIYAMILMNNKEEIEKYTEFSQLVPKDCVILTLACGKYRFNKHDFGEVAGIPRLLDLGQCNDAYSAVKISMGLADAFETDVNGLPLSIILSWYEQKAVADLLALLSLGVKGIHLGPSLPAFISPNVLQYLVDTFDLRPISSPEDDLKTCLKQLI